MSIVRILAGHGSVVDTGPPPTGIVYADDFVVSTATNLGGRVAVPFDGADGFTWAFNVAANNFRILAATNALESRGTVWDMHYTPSCDSDNQFVECTLAKTNASARYGAALGINLTNDSCYYMEFTNETTLKLKTGVAGVHTDIINATVATMVVGDRIRAEISGSSGSRLCRLLIDRGSGFVEEGSTTHGAPFAIEQRVGFAKDRDRADLFALFKGGAL